MDIKEKKKNLRKEIKEVVATLDETYINSASKQICETVISLGQYQKAETIFTFVGGKGEPDTRLIIETALNDGKRVCVPLCISDCEMKAIEIKNYESDLRKGFYGLLEPVDQEWNNVKIEDIDFAVIPCVSCNHQGNRLGHGKGYYDRYLAEGDFQTCMICFEKLVREDIPVSELDQTIDMVITEK